MGSLWLPFTQMQEFVPSTRTFVRAEGTKLYDLQGHELFDAVSSIWTTIHGHCHPRIVGAIAEQAARLDHATTLGASNPVAEELAERLCGLTGMEHALFASDGASAVEAALKIALQYWQSVGQPERRRFVRLVDSYHGDTTGAMSISDIALFRDRFGEITFESLTLDRTGAVLERSDIAAVILEPLVHAAAGVRTVEPKLYDRLTSIEPMLIVDEIATGFGRTGTMFAFEQTSLRPDILCLGKGITGGALALSATLVTERIYRAFLGGRSEARQLFHGHSYAGNPIACAAALASLEIFKSEATLEHVQGLTAHIAPRLQRLTENRYVRGVQSAGLMIGIEVHTDAWTLASALYDRGHFTRPIGSVIQLVPPLSSTAEELDSFFEAFEEELHVSATH